MTARVRPTDIVLFGTLRDPKLLGVVLGTVADAQPVSLPGYGVFSAKGESFPLVFPVEAAHAEGLLLQGLTDEQVARLDFYERLFGYELEPITLTGSQDAWIYRPTGAQLMKGALWDLSQWQQEHGPLAREIAREVMGMFNTHSVAEIIQMLAPISSRAQAQLNGRARNVENTLRHGFSRKDVVLEATHRPYSKFFAVDELTLRHRRFDGGENTIERAIFVMADAVVVLPYDPVRDTVLLIEQFRPIPYARGEANPWSLEAIAGRIDGGETPQQAAHREALEESGLHIKDLVAAAEYYPSPGAALEYLYCYIGVSELPQSAAGLGGLASEAEDIRSMVVPFEALMAAVHRGEVQNGPLLILALCLDRTRDALRAGATAA